MTPMLPSTDAPNAGAVVMHGELKQLAEANDVTLVAFAWDVEDHERVKELETLGIRVHALSAPWKRRWQLVPRWITSGQPLRTVRFQDARLQAMIDDVLESERFDALEVWDAAMGTYRYPIGIPALLTEPEVHDPGQGALLERRRWATTQRRVWRRFDLIQVFAEEDRERASRLAPEIGDRLRVNPFGTTVPPRNASSVEVPHSVVFVGNFIHRPNVDAALWLGREIFPDVRERIPDASLTIAGAYPPRAVQRLSSHAITITGRVQEVEPFIESAAVVAAPVRTGGGKRLKVLQAMALAKPVVTTSIGARGLDSAHSIPLVVADTTDAFVDALVGLLSSDGERRELGERASAYVRAHCSWEAFGARLGAIYDELLA